MVSVVVWFSLCAFVGGVSVEEARDEAVQTPQSELEEAVTVHDPIELTTGYPTATWTAQLHEMLKEKAKLYLFKPSPFLKPPFTEENDVNNVDDEVTLSRGSIKWKESFARAKLADNPSSPVGRQGVSYVDQFLEQSLMKYLVSSNLKQSLGDVNVTTFSEILGNLTEGKASKKYMALYDENKELRIKFRDEVFSRRKPESKHQGGLLEKQIQKRLEKIQSEKRDKAVVKNVTESSATVATTTEEVASTTDIETTTAVPVTIEVETTRPTTTDPVPVTTEVQTQRATPRRRSRRPTSRNDVSDKRRKNTEEDGELKLSVAETVYYRKRQLPVQQSELLEAASVGVIPGVPAVDYPMYSSAPHTGFKCPDTVLRGQRPLMMADVATRCQVFYICTGDGPAAPMLCPNGTMFNENVLVCDWWYNVSC